MRFSECPECGTNNALTRRRCARCGVRLAGGTAVALNQPDLAPIRGEALAIAAGAFLGGLAGALLWLAYILDPLWPLFFGAAQSLSPTGELFYIGTSVIGMMAGILVGAVTGEYLYALSQGVKRVNWGAALTPLVSFVAAVLLAIGVIINFEDFLAILLLPFIAPPLAVFVVLYAQRRNGASGGAR